MQQDVKTSNYNPKFIISAPRLVCLTINNLRFQLSVVYSNVSRVAIIAPRLRCFYFQASKPLVMSMVNSPLLEKVDFGISSPIHCIFPADVRVFIHMIRQFGNVRSLIISERVIKLPAYLWWSTSESQPETDAPHDSTTPGSSFLTYFDSKIQINGLRYEALQRFLAVTPIPFLRRAQPPRYSAVPVKDLTLPSCLILAS